MWHGVVYRRHEPMPILTQDEVIEALNELLLTRTVRALAMEMRVTRGYLYDVLKGKRAPGPSVLKFLDLEKLTDTAPTYRVVKREEAA